MWIALLTFSPTIIATIILAGSLVIGNPVSIQKVDWLFSDAQVYFLALGALLIVVTRQSGKPLPPRRTAVNRWYGRLLLAVILFYFGVWVLALVTDGYYRH